MSLTATSTSIIAASIPAMISVVSAVVSVTAQSRLQERYGEAIRAADAESLVAHYRDPLLRTAYDLQSRLYNMLRQSGFRGDGDHEYFRLSTLFVVAEFFGWLEIIRRDMQFINLGTDNATQKLNAHIEKIQHLFATTTEFPPQYRIFRRQQRAIGELMTVPLEARSDRPGPSYMTLGYAAFTAKMEDPDFSGWLGSFETALMSSPETGAERLRQVQTALIDLIDLLDPGRKWYSKDREKLPREAA